MKGYFIAKNIFAAEVTFKYFQPFGSFSPIFCPGQGEAYIRFAYNDISAIFSFNVGQHGGVLKLIKNGHF